MNKSIKLWRYNKVTGYWCISRFCNTETGAQWLATFKADEPDEHYVLSIKQPKESPVFA